MGATVLTEPIPSKMKAHKRAFEYLAEDDPDLENTTILFTDADTIVGRSWARSMKASAESLDEGYGSTVFGLVLFSHSDSRLTNLSRNIDHSFTQFRSRASRGMMPPIARGANCAIRFGGNKLILSELFKLPDDVFPEDTALRDLVINMGGLAQPSLRPNAIAMSRGDRYSNFAEYLAARRRKISYKALYARDYGTTHTAYQED